MTDKINVNTIVPAGSSLTLGASGGSVAMTDDVKVNTIKDAGGNTLWVSDGSGSLSSVNSGFGGAMKLLSTTTFTNQATVDITSGIDSTYKEYVFKFININPATSQAHFTWQANAVGGSGFDETFTSTAFQSYHNATDTDTALLMSWTGQGQGTAYNRFGMPVGGDADQCGQGELHLFNPASTTYVKNFYGKGNFNNSNYSMISYFGGYINTTAAIDEVSFKFESGNFDGTIALYGISS